MNGSTDAARLPLPGWTLAFVLLCATVASAFPLATYALTLAAFGIVHVLVELRYVDGRFSPRVPWRLGSLLLAGIGAIVLVRLLRLAAVLPREAAGPVELLLVAALAAAALPALARAGLLRAALGLLVVVALLAGAWWAPLPTLVVLAVLHNLTPVGFLAERLRGRTRRRALVGAALAFGVLPVVIASGLPMRLLADLGVHGLDGGALATGRLEDHLGVFVPAGWGGGRAVDLFAAAVYLQCLHYAVVIHVLPRLAEAPRARPRVRLTWPAGRAFALVLLGAGALSLMAFAQGFGDARAVYGLFALVHAWIEVPVLLLALALPGAP